MEPQDRFTTNGDKSMVRAALAGVGLIQTLEIAVRKSFAGFYLCVPARRPASQGAGVHGFHGGEAAGDGSGKGA